ncbi:MAG: hypothetical protein KC505_11305 [Myxococcales bacterium]|nr:hypothetical protein [Myxococcales bacterium]USN51168.1 MAG: hypothetical protein H6731_01800 [Myxococcales bacterium]
MKTLVASFLLGLSALSLHAHRTAEEIVNLGNWSESELTDLLSPENYQSQVDALRENLYSALQTNSVSVLKPEMNNPKALFSLSLSFVMINLVPMKDAVGSAIFGAIDKALTPLFNRTSQDFQPKTIANEAKRLLKNAVAACVESALQTLGVYPQFSNEQYRRVKNQLYQVVALAYMSETTYCGYFNRLYKYADDHLNKDPQFGVSYDQFITIVGDPTWNQSSLKDFWEIKTLKALVNPSR